MVSLYKEEQMKHCIGVNAYRTCVSFWMFNLIF